MLLTPFGKRGSRTAIRLVATISIGLRAYDRLVLGYNQCNATTAGPDSQCQTLIVNSIDGMPVSVLVANRPLRIDFLSRFLHMGPTDFGHSVRSRSCVCCSRHFYCVPTLTMIIFKDRRLVHQWNSSWR